MCKNFTITQSLGACNVGKALATISLSNNESDNKLWFKVEVSTDNQNFAVVSGAGNVEVNANSDQQVTYELLHEQRAYWRVTVTSDDNNYDDANLTTVVTETSNIVNCPLVTDLQQLSLEIVLMGLGICTDNDKSKFI